MKHGDLCTLVLLHEVIYGEIVRGPEGLLFARHHRNGWTASTETLLFEHEEGTRWLPGHLSAEHELVQAARAIQALTR